ncbi:MAG: hypothetical protein AAB652_00405 [Patescibacteria group bacterium]
MIFLRARDNRKKGQLLVELLVALSILTTGFLGVLGLLSQSLGLNRVVSENYTGTYLASEGIEIARNIVDKNVLLRGAGTPVVWYDGLSPGRYEVDYENTSTLPLSVPRPLLFDATSHTYSYAAGQPTKFTRVIEIRLVGNPEIHEVVVSSTVEWQSRGGSFKTTLEDHFFDWRN